MTSRGEVVFRVWGSGGIKRIQGDAYSANVELMKDHPSNLVALRIDEKQFGGWVLEDGKKRTKVVSNLLNSERSFQSRGANEVVGKATRHSRGFFTAEGAGNHLQTKFERGRMIVEAGGRSKLGRKYKGDEGVELPKRTYEEAPQIYRVSAMEISLRHAELA
ncbi:hypothetical protein ACLOJK_030162 [Asimina triloba]